MLQTQQVGLNPTQIYLLSLFNYNRSDEELTTLKKALTNFYALELERKKDEAFRTGILSEEKLQEFVSTHHRTPYK